jgi:hypothetical protein
MPRTVRNPKLDTRSARSKLEARREPNWQKISKGCFIGYRRAMDSGTWIARLRDETGRQHYRALGAADDIRDADGLTVFSFSQAQERARKFFEEKARELSGHEEALSGPLTTGDVLEAYFAERRRRGSKGVDADVYAALARIIPQLGALDAAKLTSKGIRDWQDAVANAPRLIRSKRLASERVTREFDRRDPEEVRKRRSTANRVLTVLKAALNHAYREGRLGSDEAWRKVKPFREVDTPVVRFLSLDKCRRLLNG